MKLHSIRQDYQDFFGLVQQYLVHPVDPVKNENSNKVSFSIKLAVSAASGWADTRHVNP